MAKTPKAYSKHWGHFTPRVASSISLLRINVVNIALINPVMPCLYQGTILHMPCPVISHCPTWLKPCITREVSFRMLLLNSFTMFCTPVKRFQCLLSNIGWHTGEILMTQ